MADEPSDACSRTDEDNARSRRKKRRYSNVYSYANEEDSVRIRKQRKVFLTAVFAAVVAMVIYVIFDEEEEEEDDDEQADLLQSSLDCLEAVKAWVGRELGPNNGISEKIIAALQDIPDLEQDDVSSAHEIFASDDSKYRSLMALPMDQRNKWLLVQIGKK